MRSALTLLSSRLKKSSSLSHSSQLLFSSRLNFLCHPSLNTLKQFDVLVISSPKLNTGFEVWSHYCCLPEDNSIPSPAGYAISYTDQDVVGLLDYLSILGCQRMLPNPFCPCSTPVSLPQNYITAWDCYDPAVATGI